MKKYNVIFTGGSVRGLSFIGVLKALEELEISPVTYTGSSIGAIFMMFYALGLSSDDIKKEINTLDLRTLFTDVNFQIFNNLAFSRGKKYLNWLRCKIEQYYYKQDYKKGEIPPVCFKDLDKDIFITAVELETSQVKVFSKYTTPKMEIAAALRASSSMPGLLIPYEYNGRHLIDGDIARGCPIWKSINYLSENKNKILEFRITGGNTNKISKNPIKMINAIVNSAAFIIDDEACQEYKNDLREIIRVDVFDVQFTDFNLSSKKKEMIYKAGYESTMKYFNCHNC